VAVASSSNNKIAPQCMGLHFTSVPCCPAVTGTPQAPEEVQATGHGVLAWFEQYAYRLASGWYEVAALDSEFPMSRVGDAKTMQRAAQGIHKKSGYSLQLACFANAHIYTTCPLLAQALAYYPDQCLALLCLLLFRLANTRPLLKHDQCRHHVLHRLLLSWQ
jgi:hypothetical protein